ncbi:MAG: sulfite exporter TauE/SafE family protein [Bacteroidota bacterium]|jgi:sulfite exporter TauE/SafE
MISIQVLLSALLLGLAGSLHCAGMCGPLILAMPFHQKGGSDGVRQLLVYHIGRILVYVFLGVLIGLIGQGVAIAGIQKGLSLAAGFFLVIMAFMIWRFEFLVAAIPGFTRYTGTIQRLIGKSIGKQGYTAALSLGALNGLLPCGLVYGALAGAISTMEAAGGGLFMLLFGTGTLPLLLTVSLLGNKAGNQIRKKLGIMQPALMIIAGMLLIMRGLHLDLSLFESAVPKAGYECH